MSYVLEELTEEQVVLATPTLRRARKFLEALTSEEEHDCGPSSELIASKVIDELEFYRNFMQGIIERIRLQVPSTVSRSVFLLKFTYSHIVRPKVQFQPAL